MACQCQAPPLPSRKNNMRRALIVLFALVGLAGCATAQPAATTPSAPPSSTTATTAADGLDRYYAGARDLEALMACLEAKVCGP